MACQVHYSYRLTHPTSRDQPGCKFSDSAGKRFIRYLSKQLNYHFIPALLYIGQGENLLVLGKQCTK